MPGRELSEKELTLMNTEFNAGGHRRNSSNPRGSISRRQSGTSNRGDIHDEHGMRLKWDEANLYLNEGQMGGRMKIDEPKTPYAGRYDPAEDEVEVSMLNAQEIAVDELEMEHAKHHSKKPRDSDIPGLDLGEPEMDPKTRRESDGDKKVIVESDDMDVDGVGHHGEERVEDMSVAEREKHKKFEEMRKRHYEMHNVKNLLG
jgi:protein phosphatase inhibitor 2